MRRLVRRGAQLANKNERMKTKFKSHSKSKNYLIFLVDFFLELFFRFSLSFYILESFATANWGRKKMQTNVLLSSKFKQL